MIDLDSLDGINIINDSCEIRALALESADSSTIASTYTSMSPKDANLLTCMLITANVGTIFEESTLLDSWFQQLKSYLTNVRPQLVAIHCQEIGGDESIVGDYTRVRIFLDENFESLEKFTALGSLYLIHDSVQNVKLYNFSTAQYEFVEGRRVYAGNSTNRAAEHVEKVKFPQELFPECRWSRKGFMRTRWLFNDNQPLDLVNIHLFHDASNLVAMETTPSPYAQNRQRALEYTLQRISEPLEGTWERQSQYQQQKSNNEIPLFIFGDFNFRLDTSKVIERITEGVRPVVKRRADSDEVLEIIYHRRQNDNVVGIDLEKSKQKLNEGNRKNDDGNSNYIEGSGVVMTVGKKLFDCENLDETFRATKNTKWLQELDNELDKFKSKLFEFEISFSPSYPFKEDTTGGYSYMKTRCPAWCDRILFNAAGSNMIHGNGGPKNQSLSNEGRIEKLQNGGDVTYRLMGNSVPMGDHKPVLLYCRLDLSSDMNHCNSSNLQNESSHLFESTAM